MKSLLDKLYNGEIYPMEQTTHDPAYWEINRQLSDKRQALEDRLSEEERRLLMEVEDLHCDLISMELRATFRYGFRLGCGMLAEVFDGWPPEKT